jgi:protein involved in polysaccharide export with SLBB domain
MQSRIHIFCRRSNVVAVSVLLMLEFSAPLWSQQQRLSYTPSTAIGQADSRAEQEAEQMVALSPEKIIQILRDETGLLLQVKKALVRKAYEQGRILDPKDLTDDAVFDLIRQDQNVRIIATQQIEERSYIRAKPTKEEIARNLPCQPPVPMTGTGSSGVASSNDQFRQAVTPKTQEEAYWLKHEDDVDCNLVPYLPNGGALTWYTQQQATQPPHYQQYPAAAYPQQTFPQQQYPQQPYSLPQSPQQQYPSPTTPQAPSTNYGPQLQMTQSQQQDYFGSDSDESQMASIQPDELPSLLSASQTGISGSMSKQGLLGGGSASAMSSSDMSGMSMPSSLGSSGSSLLGSLMNHPSSEPGFGSEEARLAERNLEVPSYAIPKQPQQPKLRHRPNPYADVPSLYDLYAQYSRRSPRLERFGEDVFRDGTGNFEQLPMDLPAGPDYVVGPGDGLTINLTGGVSQRLQRVVDREGRVALPEVGAVEVSGRNLGDVQHLVQAVLRSQFRDVDADVSLSRIRSVRVYVVGDVERPGAYDVSSLSTPLNALYLAGGPTSEGSIRIIRHYRGKQLIQQIDSYDLLLHGVRGDVQRLEAGDTIEVPPLSGLVAVEGMVRRPAIYELNGEKNLAEVLQLAGGVLPSGTLRHVDVERVESHEARTMLRLDIPETNNDATVAKALEDFAVQDGDKIKITPILPYADKTVYLDGHVSRPGKFAYREGMKVTDLITSYKDLLPEPSTSHAEIIRLSPPDYAPEVLTFNLGDALAGKDQDLVLRPFDIVRVFGRFDFEDPPIITITGEVRDPGDHLTNGVTHLRDAVYLAGGATRDALLTDAQVFRKTNDGKLEVLNVNLAKALDGDAKDNIELEPKDRVFIHRDLNKLDPPTVSVEGEVARPGKYPLGDDMTAADLVRLAGGLKRGAYTQEADLTRYELEQGAKIISDHVSVPIGAALAGQPDTDVRLRDGDVLTIEQLSGWKDVGAMITLTGEVVHPGTYGIQEGERLSSIIRRAGGFRSDAYPYGAVFERNQIRDMEEKNRLDLLDRVEGEAANIKALPEQNTQDQLAKDAAIQQFHVTLQKLQNSPPQGRLVIHISTKLDRWANTTADIQVRDGDTLHIPKRPSIVLVDGAVYNPTGITFKPGRDAGWYLQQAGGPTEQANKKAVFVIRADGSIAGGQGGLFTGGAKTAAMQPGDMVVVPEKTITVSRAWTNTVQTAQILSAVALGVEAARSF